MKNPPTKTLFNPTVLASIFTLFAGIAGCTSPKEAPDSTNQLPSPNQAEETCLQWAEDDQVPKHKLQEYLANCTEELRDNDNSIPREPTASASE